MTCISGKMIEEFYGEVGFLCYARIQIIFSREDTKCFTYTNMKTSCKEFSQRNMVKSIYLFNIKKNITGEKKYTFFHTIASCVKNVVVL